MGIQGLLPLLKSIHKHVTLKKFAGQTIGIDGYGWLHRAVVACAVELALGKPTHRYLDFTIKQVRMLLDFGITPYMVFDGDALPSKAGTNAERRKKRSAAKALGMDLYKAGKLPQAYAEFQKAASVTPEMAKELIEQLKKMDVRYIVAPYEADAQLVYLERKGVIDGILSEDSDLLVFGARRLITKLNQYGECVEIDRDDFRFCKEISLAGWTDTMFRRMAILSGCDYLPNIEKLGLKTAHRLVKKYSDPEKILRMIAFEGKLSIPAGYLEQFKRAELTFIHHRVFCPVAQRMVMLQDLDRGVTEENMCYLGAYVEPDIAIGVACGDLDPKDKQSLDVKLRNRLSTYGGQIKPDAGIRRQTLGTPAADIKKTPSINSFFRPVRTPLAELDPNTLSNSPSQRKLLERHHNTSWEPRLVHSAPVARVSTTPLTTASSRSDHEKASFLVKASALSTYQPPKRQRLCSELDSVSPSKETKRSPFFQSSAPALSPSETKRKGKRRSNRNFDVFSDDSLEEAMLSLADIQQVASPATDHTRHLDACGPAQAEPAELSAIPQSSPVAAPEGRDDELDCEAGSANSQSSVPIKPSLQRETTTSSPVHTTEFEELLNLHVRKQNAKLSRTFTSLSASQQSSALRSLQHGSERLSTNKGMHEVLTSLEKVRPVSMSTSVRKADILKTFVYQSPGDKAIALQSLKSAQPSSRNFHEAVRDITQHKSSGQTSSSSALLTAINSAAPVPDFRDTRGSEDALVPNSEDEASDNDDGALRPVVNLKGFVFIP